jgi:hypothetical protein
LVNDLVQAVFYRALPLNTHRPNLLPDLVNNHIVVDIVTHWIFKAPLEILKQLTLLLVKPVHKKPLGILSP